MAKVLHHREIAYLLGSKERVPKAKFDKVF